MESIEVVFRHFFQPDGFRAECLGDAMRVLGMSPTEDQDRPPAAMMWADRHSSAYILICRSGSTWKILGGPSTLTKGRFTISSRTAGFGTGPMFGILVVSSCSRRVFVQVLGMFDVAAGISSAFGFQSITDFSPQAASTSQDELIKHLEKVQAKR